MELSSTALGIIAAQAFCAVVAIYLAVGCIRGIKNERVHSAQG